jgi:DNA-binding response OmpR family regulator/KaiC/GvpD/RAD55 family RecA-like ATPase
MMTAKALNLIPSGIEPVDKLLGGLESGQLFMAHGEAAGKSLFGIKFLIEGLKRGESGALVIRYSSEDAVRRFARLGYDCLKDVQEGRLIILEYSDDIINQIQRLSKLAPVLRELEWLLKDGRPQRIIFDPVTQLIIGDQGELHLRAKEFSDWASSFGATVLMIANGNGKEVIEELKPIVKESFKFDFKEIDGRATRFFTFEKSTTIAEQAVEVDPSRGVFLLERAQTEAKEKSTASNPTAISNSEKKLQDNRASIPDVSKQTEEKRKPVVIHPPLQSAVKQSETQKKAPSQQSENRLVEPLIIEPVAPKTETQTDANSVKTSLISEVKPQRDPAKPSPVNIQAKQKPENLVQQPQTETNLVKAEGLFDFADFLEELDSAIAAIDVKFVEADTDVLNETNAEAASIQTAMRQNDPAAVKRPSDAANHSADREVTIAVSTDEQAVGFSRRAADMFYPQQREARWVTTNTLTLEQSEAVSLNPKNFNIIVIDEDDISCKRVANALEEYSVLTAQDSVSGIANLMALNPDLIILDIDMSIADGFKVLSHIRASSAAPIIIISKTHIRSSDRIFSTELGADYYLTKPFSTKELQQKTRQLIARYRNIHSWINPQPVAERLFSGNRTIEAIENTKPLIERRANFSEDSLELKGERVASYPRFIEQVEANVKRSGERNTSFSIVGYKIEQTQESLEEQLKRLTDLVSAVVRNADIVSINPNNELVVLLHDTNSIGARAFISRARRRLPANLNQALSVWMRSFPNFEEEFESAYAS